MKARIVIALALSTAVACGSDESTVGPSATVGALSITPGTDLIKIKGTESFSVMGTYSDGSARPVSATWSSDHPVIATVDGNGRTSAVASGQTTISADAQGQRATRMLRVLPDYQGQWKGDWIATGCVDDGDWRGACAEFPAGSLWALWLALTQTRDAVSGTVDLGDDLRGAVDGTIAMEGPLVLTGTYTVTVDGLPLEVTVSEWETVTIDNERMTGRFRFTFRAAGLLGSLGVAGEARIVAKTASATTAAGHDQGRGFRAALGTRLGKR